MGHTQKRSEGDELHSRRTAVKASSHLARRAISVSQAAPTWTCLGSSSVAVRAAVSYTVLSPLPKGAGLWLPQQGQSVL